MKTIKHCILKMQTEENKPDSRHREADNYELLRKKEEPHEGHTVLKLISDRPCKYKLTTKPSFVHLGTTFERELEEKQD